jgi:Protein of unknown function (DUF3102)
MSIKIKKADAPEFLKLAEDRAARAPAAAPALVLVPKVAEPAPEIPNRVLSDIEKEIGTLIKAQRKNIFQLGALLIEAKAKVAHGDWLLWLAQHFERSESTAENYMNAARYLAKFPTVGNLRLSMGAVYWLAEYSDERKEEEANPYYDNLNAAARNAIPEILEAAKTVYVNRVFCGQAQDKQLRKLSAAKAAATRAENKAKALEAAAVPYASDVALEPQRPPAPILGGMNATSYPIAPRGGNLSPQEIRKRRLNGEFGAAVKTIIRSAPNHALIDDAIPTERLVEASDLLLAIVKARAAVKS